MSQSQAPAEVILDTLREILRLREVRVKRAAHAHETPDCVDLLRLDALAARLELAREEERRLPEKET